MKHLLIFLILCASVFGATCQFDELVDLKWSKPGNWNTIGEDDRVPIAGDTAVILTGLAGAVEIDVASITCDEIQTQGNGTLTNTFAIVITANINNTTGTGTALTLDASDNVTIIGNVNGSDQANGYGITITGAGAPSLKITGNVTGGTGLNAHGIISTASTPVTITVNGDVTGNNTVSASQGIRMTDVSDTSVVTVTGELTGGSDSSAAQALFWTDGDITLVLGTLVYTNGLTPPLLGPGAASIEIGDVTVNGTAIGGGGYRGRYNFN